MSQYRFVTEAADYSDYASGAVLHSAPGRPAFPVRLASELFQRAYHLWRADKAPQPCALYDPCCGAGYLLTVLKLLHWREIGTLVGSDADGDALEIAAKNFALLTPSGIQQRLAQLEDLFCRFQKESHRQNLHSARRLLARITGPAQDAPVTTRLFGANALDGQQMAAGMDGQRVDIVLADVPYGETTQWVGAETQPTGAIIAAMLAALRAVLSRNAIVTIIAPRGKLQARAIVEPAPGYARIQRVRFGRREAIFWRVQEPEITRR